MSFASRVLAGCLVAFSVLPAVGQETSKRPDAIRLLPQHTVAMLQIPDVVTFREQSQKGMLRRMLNDPQIKPLIDGLRQNAFDAAKPAEEAIGVSIPDILDIPQGELTIAIVAPEEKRPSLVLMIDAGEKLETIRKLLEKGEEALAKGGGSKREEEIDGTKVVVYDMPEGPREIVFCERESTFLLGSNFDTIKDILGAWSGTSTDRLAQNANFSRILAHTRVPGETAHATWFVDPISLLRGMGVNNAGPRTALVFLPLIGLDGFLGAGGSVSIATEQYDFVSRAFVLLDSPRSGVLDLISLTNGDTTPEPFVPGDAAEYLSLNWDMETTYQKVAILLDGFRGEGWTSKRVQRIAGERLGVDFEKEFLPLLDDRLIYFTWMERPITVRSGSLCFGIRVNDTAKLSEMLAHYVDLKSDRLTKREHAGQAYYEVVRAENADTQPEPGEPRICFGIISNYLVIGDRPSVYRRAIDSQLKPEDSLAEQVDYKIIASKLKRLANGKAGLVSFMRPEEGLRFVYDLVQSEQAKKGLEAGAEGNKFIGNVRDTVNNNPLPPFEVIAKYLAPGGRLVTEETNGYSYTAFTLKRETE